MTPPLPVRGTVLALALPDIAAGFMLNPISGCRRSPYGTRPPWCTGYGHFVPTIVSNRREFSKKMMALRSPARERRRHELRTGRATLIEALQFSQRRLDHLGVEMSYRPADPAGRSRSARGSPRRSRDANARRAVNHHGVGRLGADDSVPKLARSGAVARASRKRGSDHNVAV